MIVLVDYHNVEYPLRRLGPKSLAIDILSSIAGCASAKTTRILIRLYGGWYDNRRLTRLAQDLAADVARSFPSPCLVTLHDRIAHLPVAVELAFAIAAAPTKHLFHTLRHRPVDDVGCLPIELARLAQNGKLPFDGAATPGLLSRLG